MYVKILYIIKVALQISWERWDKSTIKMRKWEKNLGIL